MCRINTELSFLFYKQSFTSALDEQFPVNIPFGAFLFEELSKKRYHKRLLDIEMEPWHSDACYFYDSTAFESPCQRDNHLKSCERLIHRSWLHGAAWRSLNIIVLVVAPCGQLTKMLSVAKMCCHIT